MPELFSVHTHNGEGTDALPAADTPYYVFAKEGLFLHKKTQIGSVLIKEDTMPKHITLGTLGHEHGLFTWAGPRIPATIISQALDFFRRIYEKHHAEAEVLLTMHNDTGVVRIFVPYQRVSGGGVKSVFEPTHIDPDYTIIGTIHSHCMMDAFHSGTDSKDASDMDGVHFTIGRVMDNPPQIVAMVAMNGMEFHYKNPADIADLVFDADTAPAWWDRFIFPSNTEAAKPKGLKTITAKQWDEFRGLSQPKPKIQKLNTGYRPSYVKGSENEHGPYGQWSAMDYVNRLLSKEKPTSITHESRKFNRKHQPTVWGEHANDFYQTVESVAIDLAIDHAIQQNVLSASDWANIDAAEMDDIVFWKHNFLTKIESICEVLELLGCDVTFSVKDQE